MLQPAVAILLALWITPAAVVVPVRVVMEIRRRVKTRQNKIEERPGFAVILPSNNRPDNRP